MDSRNRTQHPRRLSKVATQPQFRKQASSNTRELVAREDSWEPLDSPTRSNRAPMRPESPLFSEDAPLQDTLDSIRAVGDRISKEVEDFAMHVDQYLEEKKHAQDDKDKFDAAMQLLDRLKKVAISKHTELKRENEQTRRQENLSRSWQGRIQGVADRTGRGSSVGSGTALSLREPTDDASELHQWQSEINSWDLLRTMTDLSVNNPSPQEKQMYADHNPSHKFTPGPELWTQFVLLDDAAREKKVVLEWLERCARSSETSFETITEQLEQRAGAGSGTWSRGWLNTREKIKAHKRFQSISGAATTQQAVIKASDSSRLLVTQLDPDAPTRQGQILEKKDEYYERSLWLACYEMIRRGMPWDNILEWCEDHHEGWRAASLGAAQDLGRKSSRLCLNGPYAGALWRRTCFAIAQQTTADKYERAVYGLLAGDVLSVEPVYQSWEDRLYANYNAQLLAAFEDWLQKKHPEQFPSVLAQKFPLYKPITPVEDTEEAKKQLMAGVLKYTEDVEGPDMPMKRLQGVLVAHGFEQFALDLGTALRVKANKDHMSLIIEPAAPEAVKPGFMEIAEDWDVIRITVHMLIIQRNLGLSYGTEAEEDIVDDIIVTYMDFLRTLGKFDAIPTYGLCLDSESTRNRILGVMISDITDKSEQDRLVQLMNQAGLDMTKILSEQWSYTLAILGIDETEPRVKTPGNNQSITRFELVEPADERWAGWRVQPSFSSLGSIEIDGLQLIDLISAEEQRIVRSLEWFFIIKAKWKETFAGIATVMKALLRTGHFMAALAVSAAVPVHAMSRHLSENILGRAVDVHEDPEYIEEEHTPELRRSTRTSSQREVAVQSKEPSAEAFDFRRKVALMKKQSQQVLELQTLCQVLEALAMWRYMEDSLEKDNNLPFHARKDIVEESLHDLVASMKPLFGDFLTLVANDSDELLCRIIRYAYFPDIFLAYNGAITFASSYCGPEALFKSLDLANAIADEKNYELTNAFIAKDKLGALVTSLALSQRMMLRLNQQIQTREKKEEKANEIAARRELGLEVLLGGGDGMKSVLGKSVKGKQNKAKTLSRKKSALEIKRSEWVGETVDIWEPR